MKLSNINVSSLASLPKHTMQKKVRQEEVDLLSGIISESQTREIMNSIHQTIDRMITLSKLKPYEAIEPDVVAELLGVEALGLNTITNAIKNGYMVLRNFFLKLKDAVVAFFKYLFDVNSRTRKALAAQMRKFTNSNKTISQSNSPTVSLITYGEMESTLAVLDRLFTSAQAVYKANNKEAILAHSEPLKTFGYQIEDYRIKNPANEIEFQKQTRPLLSSTSTWVWSIQALTEISNKVIIFTSKAEKLNYIREKINNSVKSATYTIDRYNMIGDAEKAIKIQTELNDVALVAGYLFNCAAIFQKKVDMLASQLIEAWNTLNTID